MDEDDSSGLGLKRFLIIICILGILAGGTTAGKWLKALCEAGKLSQLCQSEADQSPAESIADKQPVNVAREVQIRNVATGHCLDSGGDASAVKVYAYTYGACGNPSGNLKWIFDGTSQQIRNVATGFCLDSGGDLSAAKVRVWTYQNCTHSSGNLKWTYAGSAEDPTCARGLV
jgi:putative hemolysin